MEKAISVVLRGRDRPIDLVAHHVRQSLPHERTGSYLAQP